MKLNGSEILMECLLEQGVDTVFGYPGGTVLNIYDALYKYSDRIHHVLTAHEQGASHAADGYSRTTGKVGVCIATSGPGATNLVTGIATAYMDSIPMVAITGNVATGLLGRDSFQEIDITGVTIPITKHNFLVKDVEQLADTVRLAFEIAMSGRPGPVLVDIPKDVSAAMADYTPAPTAMKRPIAPPKQDRLDRTVEILKEAKRPLLYIGGGVIAAGAANYVRALAEKLDIPVCASLMGLGGFPADHPLWLGMVGMHGTKAANCATRDCDALIVCGARFSDRVAGNPNGFAAGAKIIHLDVDHAEFDKNVMTTVRLAGDLKETLSIIKDRLDEQKHPEWLAACNDNKVTWPAVLSDPEAPLDPSAILRTLRDLTERDTVLVTDVGQHQMWSAQFYAQYEPRHLLTSGGLGTMGYGMGAAIGAQFAKPDSKVVLVTGDGCFHMNLNELTTMVSHKLPVVILLMDNRVLGMVRQWQKVFYGKRFAATDPERQTDFPKLAEAFGCKGLVMEKNGDILPVLREALSTTDGPVLVDCRISKDVNVLPMIPPGGSVEQMIESMEEYEK